MTTRLTRRRTALISIATVLAVSAAPPLSAPAASTVEVSGRVSVDAEAAPPVDGAIAVLCPQGSTFPEAQTWADADGRFSFTDVPPGKYTLQVVDPRSSGADPDRYLQARWYGGGYEVRMRDCWPPPGEPQPRVISVGDSDVSQLDVALPVGGRVAGLATDRKGHPITGVHVDYPPFAGSGTFRDTTGPDSVDGYQTALMQPGDQELTFSFRIDDEDWEKTITVPVEAGKTAAADVRVPVAGNTLRSCCVRIDAPPMILPAAATLTAVTPRWYHDGTEETYRWLRDGKAIKGATDKTYRITRADAGHDVTVQVTGNLDGLPPQRYESDPVAVPDVIVRIRLNPDTAPTTHPERIHALVSIDPVTEAASKVGTVKLWDPLGIQEDRFYEPYLAGEGRVGANGTAEISVDPDLFWDLEPYYGDDPSSEVWAEFIPDDAELNGGRSSEVGYQLTES